MKAVKHTPTVLLLSAPIGSGHRLAAEALEQVLRQQPGLRVVHGNIFDFFPHFLGTAFLRCYLWILGHCPWLYALAYKWGNKQGGSLWLRSLLNHALAFLGRSYLEKLQPDAVIATHATPAGIIGCYKRSHPGLWLGAVVTDYTVHRWWLCEGVDTYFIADELLRGKITLPVEVLATGIPVREQFVAQDKQYCRQKFGWSSGEKVCLLMGGGEGLLPMEEIIAALQQAGIKGLSLVAVTGHNEGLAAVLRTKYGTAAEIYGFREDAPQLMAAADLLITKAGGLTCAEVLACGLQLLIYKPLPGQEEGNAAFMHRHCGAYVAHTLPALVKQVQEAVHKTDVGEKSSQHAHPEAAAKICAYALKKIQKA